MARKKEVLDSFPFLENDTFWCGAAEVVRTETESNTHIDLYLRVGSHRVRLPSTRGEVEIIKSIELGFESAKRRYRELLEELNKE